MSQPKGDKQKLMTEAATNKSSFFYHLSDGACEKCQKFLVLSENLSSDSKSMNFGSVFVFVRIKKKTIFASKYTSKTKAPLC